MISYRQCLANHMCLNFVLEGEANHLVSNGQDFPLARPWRSRKDFLQRSATIVRIGISSLQTCGHFHRKISGALTLLRAESRVRRSPLQGNSLERRADGGLFPNPWA